ncbi:MAG TPA: FAD-binding oxidoreductase [Bdellovibrionota bacterium]|nr:FAD-binding oxidoreductase [Bdellovibrionota bacterium]
MPVATKINCQVTETKWLTPTVVGIRFEPSKRFHHEPGQFLSLIIPGTESNAKPARRIYSFAANPEKGGYQLCIKVVPNGIGSNFMASLKIGDIFKATAPYGDFLYEPKKNNHVCFIATGTGVAPFRSIAMSDRFLETPPPSALMLFGARTEDEIVYPGFFESVGIHTVNAISKPTPAYKGYHGRVTDYLRSLPTDWNWHSTEFYLCGNGSMIMEARRILLEGHGVPERHVHQEAYFEPAAQVARIGEKKDEKAAA